MAAVLLAPTARRPAVPSATSATARSASAARRSHLEGVAAQNVAGRGQIYTAAHPLQQPRMQLASRAAIGA